MYNTHRDDKTKFIKVALVRLRYTTTLTACTGHIENRDKNCSYDYLLHPAISISKIIGGCGPTAQ
ncbi:DUF4223 domain-containing protein [Escherichia coli]|nr:DUF4223 domain-containing protein [Escherichia coli]